MVCSDGGGRERVFVGASGKGPAGHSVGTRWLSGAPHPRQHQLNSAFPTRKEVDPLPPALRALSYSHPNPPAPCHRQLPVALMGPLYQPPTSFCPRRLHPEDGWLYHLLALLMLPPLPGGLFPPHLLLLTHYFLLVLKTQLRWAVFQEAGLECPSP